VSHWTSRRNDVVNSVVLIYALHRRERDVNTTQPFSALAAAARAHALLDPQTTSPLWSTASVWVGEGRIDGRDVLLALTDGHQRGGTIGVEDARVLARIAAGRRRKPIVMCWDTGGVRVQEGSPALAAVAAIGVGLTRLAMLGTPIVTVISGPRGCFGAPSVVAATAHHVIITEDALWGLTGPTLLNAAEKPVDEAAGRSATSARHRYETGQATRIVADSASALRAAVGEALAKPLSVATPLAVLDRCVQHIEALATELGKEGSDADTERRDSRRRRDFLRYSIRGQWNPTTPEVRRGHVHAAWGELNRRPALAIVVGGERSPRGIGIADAAAVTSMVRFAVAQGGRAPIVTFLFCRGHDNDLAEERAGLPVALAECLKSLVAARLLGHPLLCVLGGGAYGAAYLSLAAPSHRILAIRGTTVAPMAPRVLAAFQRLRGIRNDPYTPQDLAQLIPEIRIVESVVRLPRVLNEEWSTARRTVRPVVRGKATLYL
jgi:acetyl-CoA carboxylase alpha subunit